MTLPPVTFAIMAGGKGERLWPLVRRTVPKVCLSPTGGRSLIQQTLDRLRPVVSKPEWLVIPTRGQELPIRRALVSPGNLAILVEPQGRNTAACIALAAVRVAARHPKGILVAVPADHWIGDVPAFQRAMRQAIAMAARYDALVTLGISPTAPHTGLGYIQTRGRLASAGKPPVFRLRRFIEKPSPEKARALIKSRGTFWNSGMFVGKAEVFLERITEWLPNHASILVKLADDLRRSKQGVSGRHLQASLRAAYRRLKPISFDYGVMQHLQDGLVVEGCFGWEDLGSWDVWARLGSAFSPKALVDSERVAVVSQPGHLVAAIGVHDLLVVQTPTATLVCRADHAQDVRAVVKQLAANRRLAAYL